MRTEETEAGLTSLFDRQAAALPAGERKWAGEEYGRTLTASPRRRRPLLLVAAVVPLIALLVVALVASGSPREELALGDGAPFHVETRQVILDADAVSIDVGDKTFVTAQPMDVNSDPGDDRYTTLELTWTEHGAEMRIYIYFTSDGIEWWSNEIRTYDGNQQGEWITYTGEFFRTPRDAPFVGDLDVSASASDRGVDGRLRMENMRLEAFRGPEACAKFSDPFILEPDLEVFEIGVGPDAMYGFSVTLLDTASCTPVADEDRYTYRWSVGDPAILTAEPDGSAVLLQASKPGTTSLHVTAEDPATGAVLAEADMEVIATTP